MVLCLKQATDLKPGAILVTMRRTATNLLLVPACLMAHTNLG